MSQQVKQKQNLPIISKAYNTKSKIKFTQNSQSIHAARSISAFTAYRKFDNVEKISTILQDIQSKQVKKQSKKIHKQPNLHQKVIDTFKQKIKMSFNQLYDGYESNKNIINKQIKNLQKNKTAQFQMNNRFEQSLKEKSQYDKIKAQVELKKKKLEKLKQVLKKQQQFKFESQQLKQQLDLKSAQLLDCEVKREDLDYQKAVLINMRFQRRNLKRTIKQRFNQRWQNWVQQNKKIDKYWNQTEGKKLLLKKIAEKLPSDDPQIPEQLAHELEKVIEQFYGKQAFLNIFHHQNILNEAANRKQLKKVEEQKQEQKLAKQEAERQQKREYELIEQKYLLKKNDEQKIRKVCAVNNLNEIVQNPLNENQKTLKQLKQSYQIQLIKIKKQNQVIRAQIDEILSKDSKNQQNLRNIQKAYMLEHEQERKLHNQMQKCNKFLEEIYLLIQRVTSQSGNIKSINLELASFSSRVEKYTLLEKIQDKQTSSKMTKKQGTKKQNSKFNQSQQIDQKQIQDEATYLSQNFKNRK